MTCFIGNILDKESLRMAMPEGESVTVFHVAVQGGEIETFNHPLDEGCANKLLKSYSMKYKIQLLLAKLRKKPMTLKDGFSFFMASGTKNVIHRAVASKKNKQDMLLLGIEIKKVIC